MSSTWSPEPSSSSYPPSPMTPESNPDVVETVAVHGESFADVPMSWYEALSGRSHNSSRSWAQPAKERHSAPGLMLGLDDLLEQNAFEELPSTTTTATSSDSSQSPSQPASQSRPTFLTPHPLSPISAKTKPGPTSRIPNQDSSTAKQKVVFPPKESCINLPIITPSIPEGGTKSRVETQIRVTLDLADALPPPNDPFMYDRVGSWKWLKLPPGTATKKRTRKQGKIDPSPEDILYLNAVVSCATPPHNQVLSCSSCQNREAKRVAKKIAARVRPNKSDSESVEDQPKSQAHQEDTTNIIQFNCADSLEFSAGTAVLPLRLTCYCRHHKEKVGFIVHFALVDHLGRMVGAGSTRPIMITDDHKTPKAPSNVAATETPTHHSNSMDVDWTKTTPVESTAPSKRNGKESSSKKRPKPYDSARHNPRRGREESVSTTNSPSSIHSPLPGTRSPTPPQPSASAPNVLDSILFPNPFPEPNSLAFPFFPAPPLAHPSVPPTSSLPPPMIHRLIPAAGPTCGGIEVTVLGSNFHPSLQLKCVFGDAVAENTTRWSDNTLVCVLPPRASAGVVGVWFKAVKDDGSNVAIGGLGIDGSSVPFTYTDESDRALMELALQIVGLKMTGKIEGAKDVAMRIMGSTGAPDNNLGGSTNTLGTNQLVSSTELAQAHLHDVRPLLLMGSGNNVDRESVLVNFLSILDVQLDGPVSAPVPTSHALNLTNSSGQTIAHLATFMGLEKVLRFLIARGADLDIRDRNGFTALHFAAFVGGKKGEECTRALLAAGADPEIVDIRGMTAAEYADHHGDITLLRTETESVSSGECIDSVTGEVTDEEATWGDAEEEDSDDRSTTLRPRRRITARRSRPHLRKSPSDEKALSEKAALRKEEEEKQRNATFLADLIQRTLAQLQNHAPQALTQLPMPQLAEKLPWNALPLPAIPMVFPVFIPTPGWPAFLSGEKGVPVESGDEPKVAAGMASIRAALERWVVQPKPAEVVPPPAYTPRAEPDETPANKRVGHLPRPVSKQEVDAFAYQPPPKEQLKKKQDKMLLLFWLPTLILSLLWALYNGFHFVLNTAKEVITLRAGTLA